MKQPKRASEIEAEKIEWLWPLPGTDLTGRIPRGMLAIVAGKPDQGKGLFATHVAADVSRGNKYVEPGNVLYSAAEDSHSLMTRPRLEAAGADLERVSLWRFRLPESQNELAEIVMKREIDLVVIDPLASSLSGNISRHSDNIRTVLGPLTELIEGTQTAVLIIEHALKRVPKSGHPLDAIGGSGSGLPAAARAAYVFGYDPDDGDRRVLAPAKFNVGPMPQTIAFEIDVDEISMKTRDGAEFIEETPYLLIDEELEAFDAMRIFESKTQPGKKGRPNDKRAAAAEWLTTYLAENGPSKQADIVEDAKQYQMSRRTVERASADMGVIKGKGRHSKWELPDDVKELMGLKVEKPKPAKKPNPANHGDDLVGSDDDVDKGIADLLGDDS